MANLKSSIPCLPNPCSITGQPFLGARPSAWVVLHQKVDFHKFALNLCQPRGIYCNLKAHLSIKKISAEVWKSCNGHNTWKECWYHMTTHNGEVCVMVSHLSRGAHVKNQNASLQISVYVFTLYFVKMDIRRCQKSKTSFWWVLCCLGNRHHINHLETGRKAFHRRTPCTLAALRAKCCWP